ncbi:hypothetical protein Tco_0780524 [Tanacetum coccineum]
MTARKRVGPLPTHRLAMRHSVDYSSSDHFSSDDSSRDSSSSSLSGTYSDFFADALSDSASSHPYFNHSLPTPSSGMRPSHHLCSLVLSIHRSSALISDRPSHDYSFASPSRKRSRSPAASVPSYLYLPLGGLGVDFEDESSEPFRSRGTDLEEDVEVLRSDGIDIDPEIQADIVECIAYADSLRDRGIDARVVVEPTQEGAIEVTYETLGDLVKRFHHHTEEISVHRVQDIESRVARSQRRELRVQREMRQIRRFRFYDRMRIARLEAYAKTMPNTRSGALRTREGINEQIDHQMTGALGARMEEMEMEEIEMEEMEIDEIEMEEMEMPLSFNGTEEVVGLTRWFKKMEMVFHISNCLEKYQVKHATCTLLNSALTWWNSHKRTIMIEAAYAMSWAELMKLMTEVYCLINEVQKMDTEMVPNEEDKVERFVGGLPDNNREYNAAAPTNFKMQIRIGANTT